ncbi:MAG TPA: type II toxin-antitoxin system RelE/ParE family toxin [Candidatus Goldiibacteriota bacterium]|nr:type II toxin-antitoxin system RelE/ParE family toxin [Candidatus Goldiibacteriota bacterium]HPI02334.1 type II toxin-antitoxin system RelE/ParE family toxin [Candidatus Goldiibacteriota bacterium]HPN65710.1 type II toxin-antitoxin system RelE/ParE family toxin [Candidatus Goldiibacteriota bacterium]HRQ44543.1 type II toxin-antitoxin system RelE/ParE family toxin [Candidatus Goldiibacteriota bacterium]
MPRIDFYVLPSGRRPVIEFIENECPDEVKGKVFAGIKDIEEYGTKLLHIKPGTVKALGEKLFELKIYGEDKCFRFIHAYVSGNTAVFLHAFIKKRQKTDPDDIEESRKRLKKYMAGKREK